MSFGNRKIPKHLIIEEPYSNRKTFGFGWVILAVIILLSSMLISMHVRGADKDDSKSEAVNASSRSTLCGVRNN